MTHPVQFTRPPDKTLYDAALFDDNWERKGIDAYGTQASFDIFTRGQTDRGLRVTAARQAGRIGDQGNALVYSTTHDGNLPYSLTWAAAMGTISGNVRGSTTLSAVKASIDAFAGTPFTTAYFGGENGTGNGGDGDGLFSGGTPDNWAWFTIVCLSTAGGRVLTGTAVPTAGNVGNLCGRGSPTAQILRPGHSIYTVRTGSGDLHGAIALWAMPEGEWSKFAR